MIKALRPVHIATFLYINAGLNLCFSEAIHATPHTNAQELKFINMPFKVDTWINGGLKKAVDKCEGTKTDICPLLKD